MDGPSPPEVQEEGTTLSPGARLGKYQIVRLLGAGGMGAVYEATHTEIGKRVAIKTLAPAVATVPGARQRFLREAQLTSRLRHPHIVDMTDMGSEGRVAYLVMELLVGEDLAHLLERTGPMAPSDLVDLMLPVCSALVAAHEAGIVHRDLKPQNVFLAAGPRGVTPKVLDFGISKSNDTDTSSSLTNTGAVIGTPHYLAPEQVQDARAASSWRPVLDRRDLLSLPHGNEPVRRRGDLRDPASHRQREAGAARGAAPGLARRPRPHRRARHETAPVGAPSASVRALGSALVPSIARGAS